MLKNAVARLPGARGRRRLKQATLGFNGLGLIKDLVKRRERRIFLGLQHFHVSTLHGKVALELQGPANHVNLFLV